MNTILSILTKLYSYTLYLYPASYRKAFQKEMLLDFKDMLADANKKGILSLIAFCLREARDIPLSLVSTHLEENRTFHGRCRARLPIHCLHFQHPGIL